MARKKFHLGWFTNFAVDEWEEPFASAGGAPWSGEFYVDLAKALERACFDYMILEDTLMVSDIYGGGMDRYLRGAIAAPKHDPAPLAAVIAAQTSRLGVVATLSTLGYPPFLLARLCATIDHIAQGRFGWNIVTSGEDAAAQNFGLDKITEHDLRYEMADEYVELVGRLFGSWDADAVVLDRQTGTYADPAKVRTVDFNGRFYRCRGPLNTAPLPHGRPVYVQAGGSPRGRDFAARHADSIIAAAGGPEKKSAPPCAARSSILHRWNHPHRAVGPSDAGAIGDRGSSVGALALRGRPTLASDRRARQGRKLPKTNLP